PSIETLELATGVTTLLLSSNGGLGDPSWVAAGVLLVPHDGLTTAIVPAGRALLGAAELPVGDSTFTAIAEDAGHNDSDPSAPIVVHRGTGDLPDLIVDDITA